MISIQSSKVVMPRQRENSLEKPSVDPVFNTEPIKPSSTRKAIVSQDTNTEDSFERTLDSNVEESVTENTSTEQQEKLTKDQQKRLYDLMNKRAAKTNQLYLKTQMFGIDPNKKLKELSTNPLFSFGWGALFGGGFAGLFVAMEKLATSNFKLKAIDLYIILPFLLLMGGMNVFSDMQINEGIAQFLKIHGQNSKVKDLWKQMSGLEGTKEDLKLKP
jgi:hypothetical protein